MIVERTDFISVPVRDMERSKRFYAETLGLPSPNLDGGWPEFETGNVSLYLMDPTNVGQEFSGPHTAHIALRVPDVAEARGSLEATGRVLSPPMRRAWRSGASSPPPIRATRAGSATNT